MRMAVGFSYVGIARPRVAGKYERRAAVQRMQRNRMTSGASQEQPQPRRFGHLSDDQLRYKLGAAEDSPVQTTSALDTNTSAVTLTLFKAVGFASVGAFLFGYHLGVVNGPLDVIASDLGFAANKVLQGAVVSSLLAGAAVGSSAAGGLADALGRRLTLGLDTILMAFGALLCASAWTFPLMITGRLVTGIAIGISSTIVPLYISEVSPTSIRGALGSFNQLAICIGILGALCINVIYPAAAWRSMFYLSIIPAILLALGMSISPESPRWLVAQKKTAEAQRTMQDLWRSVDPSLIDTDAAEKSSGNVVALSKQHMTVLAIASALFAFQQFSGINAIVYYSTEVFKKAGMTNNTLASAAVGVTNVAGTVLASTLMDRAGRKQLLSLSYFGMGVSMAAMALGFASPSLAAFSGSIALCGTLLYILSFGLGVGPVPGLLVPELAPAEIRGRAVSFALTTHWATNFAIGLFFLPVVEGVGIPVVYTFFAVVCFGAILFVRRFVVETKGKSLEQIEEAMTNEP